ncbi:alpha/beta fold hydrolase [Pseudenhygromyxa sp. WMMC2535]|uniref:alpha/beta hydrolase n=1 Tax=Pseudenhygromyxa sp. WMMC2535 TaxID=2712867 RepID=UPI00155482A2|nr:YqiA/YcfP family alpha/beta fold hydrolase [Pseudenhygromyxa sp. WMMC2535]NVB37829.1 alpha/beta fold hydrolase [Pseudenhygromyxa sp. WMMC2535]
MSIRYAYLHGFASSSLSAKGQALRRVFDGLGRTLHLPDLNYPSFAELSYTGMLEAFDRFDRQLDAGRSPRSEPARWRLIGSSMGGYLAARWAALHPERVDRLLLLCPAFDFAQRWPQLLGDKAFADWERAGSLPMPGPAGAPVEVHWGLVEDGRQHPPRPAVPCPTTIIHGTRDTVVPIDSSRSYIAEHPEVELIEVDDDHTLMASLATLAARAQHWLVDPPRRLSWDFFGADALGTAEHFRVHLDEFLVREDLGGCETGVETPTPTPTSGEQATTWCRCPERLLPVIGPALRPHRVD